MLNYVTGIQNLPFGRCHCRNISYSKGVQGASCRAAGASSGQGCSHLPRLLHHQPSAHTTTPWAGSGSLPQKSPSEKDTHFGRTGSPWAAAPDVAMPAKARTPAGKSSHLGQSISHPLHAVPCKSSKPKSSHRSRGDRCSYSWLGNQTGSVFAKYMFYLNWMPIRVRRNKSTKSLQLLGLVFLSTSYKTGLFQPSFSYPIIGGRNLKRDYLNESTKNWWEMSFQFYHALSCRLTVQDVNKVQDSVQKLK